MTRLLRRTWKRLLGGLSRRTVDDDFAQELDAHIQMLADEHVRCGVPPHEAHRRARLRFGSLESVKASYRDQRGLPVLDAVVQDLRYAVRGLRANPGFATVAVLSLAIGIGANTAIFSLVNAVLFRPLAYQDPRRVFAVHEHHDGGRGPWLVNPVHAREWGAQCPSLEHVALLRSDRVEVATGGEPAAVAGASVAHNLFALLGVEPMLGRAFRAEEELAGNDRVAIVSEALWRGRFNADPSLVGTSVVLDGEHHDVVGVMAAGFRLPMAGAEHAHIFRPLVLGQEELTRLRGNYNYAAVARVREGAPVERALAEVNAVQARFLRGDGVADLTATLVPVHDELVADARLGLWMVTAAVGAVLLIVCINLANLLLSRIASRSREAAIRTALGASRGRQVRLVLTESLLLAVAGGALALLLAHWSVSLLVAMTTLGMPRLDEVRLDTGVVAFVCGLTLLTGVIVGALPAWRFTRAHPQDSLRSGGRTVTEGRQGLRLREALIGVEVGLSAALLIVAGLLAGSLVRLLHVDKGFDVDHVLTVDVTLASSRYAEPASRAQFVDRLLASVATIPGVQASGVVTRLPTLGQTWMDPIYLEGAPREAQYVVNNRYTSPDYFRAMSIAVRGGRMFEDRDREQGVAVLSEKAAQLLWPGDPDPIGRRFMGEQEMVTLVGIVADVRAVLHNEPPPTAYYPYWQRPPAAVALVARTAFDPDTVAGALRDALRNEDAGLPIQSVNTMAEVVDRTVAGRTFQATLLAAFAASALLVASLGIYGVVAYAVARRRNEIGVRIALGARPRQVLWLVLRQGMVPVVAGLVAGVVVALFLGRAIRGLLFEVQAIDPLTIAAVTVVLLGVGTLACLVPARQAAITDAVSALRLE